LKLLGVLLLVAVWPRADCTTRSTSRKRDQNDAARVKLQAKLRENAELEAYKPNWPTWTASSRV